MEMRVDIGLVRVVGAVSCDQAEGALTAEQQETARVMTPYVGISYHLAFVRSGRTVYTSETYYKPVGATLTEHAVATLDLLFPGDCWPRGDGEFCLT